MIIDVERFHKGERWFGARFRVPNHDYVLQVYGPTEFERECRINEVLDYELGAGTYVIKVTNSDA